jgi:NAD(P)-dependent dehydrogenase (short-subunit alcohol dehydrogenase family)
MPNTDRAVAVLGAKSAVGEAIASGLRLAGHQVVSIDDYETGAKIAAAIQVAAPAGVAAVIDAGFFVESPAIGELALTDVETWQRQAEQPLRRALHVLQGAHLCLAGDGGRIVVLLPSLVMSGAAGVVAWASAAEGYRSLVKAAARAWGGEGITIKSVLIPASLTADSAVDRPGLQPPALGRIPDLQSDIGPAVAALLDERLDAVTGLTLAIDGGVWMTS